MGLKLERERQRKYVRPRVKKLILPTLPEDVLFSKLFASYLAHPTFISMHAVAVLLSPNCLFLIHIQLA